MKLKVVNCNHWEDCLVKNGGCCKINEYEKPSYSVCLKHCKKNTSLPNEEGVTDLQVQARQIENLINEKDMKNTTKIKEFFNHLKKNPLVLVIDSSKLREDEDIYSECKLLLHEGLIYVDTLSKCWQEQVRKLNLTKTKKRGITWENFKSITSAVLTGNHISKERQEARLKVCHDCELFKWNEHTQEGSCGVCGCKLSGSSAILELTSYEETDKYGCKHPTGSKWKENGV